MVVPLERQVRISEVASIIIAALGLDAPIANAKLADMAGATLKGRTAGAAGAPVDLTTNQVKVLLSVDHLIALTGVDEGSEGLGAFAGGTIADGLTVKGALQELETAFEGVVVTGPPQTLTSTTVNENSELGHSHAISSVDVVTAGIAAMTSGTVGCYALLRHNQMAGSLSPGTARAGSNLQWANAGGAGSPGSPNGTWRCEGYIDNTNDASGANRTTLFRRIL